MNLYLIIGLAASSGCLLGYLAASFLYARDSSIVRLQEDETVIKRPMPNLILVQVTPEVARRLINLGDVVSSNPGEARALYPERLLSASLNNAPQK